MDDHRERVDRVAGEQHVELHQRALAVADDLVVERGVAARARLQLVVEVEDDLGQRQVVDDLLALLDRLHRHEDAAPVLAEAHHRADALLRHEDRAAHVGLLDEGDARGGRQLGRASAPGGARRPVSVTWYSTLGVVASSSRSYSRSSRSRTMSMCSRPEEAAAEAEAERLGGLGLPAQRGVVERQLLERVAQVGVVVGVHREEAAEDHRLDLAVARAAPRRPAAAATRQRVAHPQVADALEPGHQVAGLPRRRARPVGVIAGAITPISSASTTSPVCIARSRSRCVEARRRPPARRPRRRGTGRRPSRRSGPARARPGRRRAAARARRSPRGPRRRPRRSWPRCAAPGPGSSPTRSATARPCSSGSAAGRSILFSTGISSRSPSMAR